MKKLFLLMALIFTSVFVLVSCGSNGDPGESISSKVSQCEHTYGEWEIVKQPTETEKCSKHATKWRKKL